MAIITPEPSIIDGFKNIRIIQKELEWRWLVDQLKQQQVRSLMSIGLLDGGTEWHTSRVFHQLKLPLSITGIDPVSSKKLRRNRAEIESRGHRFRFLHGSSRDPQIVSKLSRYDAVFIDGDHSYAGVKADYELALTVADKMIAFHDIVDSEYHREHGCFVADLWRELKNKHEHTEEYILADDWAGIGIIYV